MSRAAKLLAHVLDPGREQGLRFSDIVRLLHLFGFEERQKGSHRVFVRRGIPEMLNVQPRTDGTAKPYQVRQVRRVILAYGLHLSLNREEADDA